MSHGWYWIEHGFNSKQDQTTNYSGEKNPHWGYSATSYRMPMTMLSGCCMVIVGVCDILYDHNVYSLEGPYD